jgi:serine/threonine-protein kinase
MQDSLIGTTLGNYRILGPLGQGGMARVYKAYQENLDREVAVKVLPPWYAADRNFVERFNLEARLVARLSHPNIVTVHDANEQQGHLYIVMQLVDGGTLKQRLDALQQQGKVMNLALVTPIFTQIASALAYAHEQGIIHRDVKPVNVLMDSSGRPILSDFGIAKVLAATKDNLTRPGAGVGTPEYMSPEQCQGAQVDGRADIYALGVMLFEAMTGRVPFQGDNYPALAHSHLYEQPPRPATFNPAISPAVEQIILKALMKQPQQRYQHAHELADALNHVWRQSMTPVNPPPAGDYRQYQQAEAPFPGQASPPPFSTWDSPKRNAYDQNILRTPPLPQVSFPCPKCGNLNRPQMKFCTRCGQELKRCFNCGTANPAGNRFCTKCGRQLPL